MLIFCKQVLFGKPSKVRIIMIGTFSVLNEYFIWGLNTVTSKYCSTAIVFYDKCRQIQGVLQIKLFSLNTSYSVLCVCLHFIQNGLYIWNIVLWRLSLLQKTIQNHWCFSCLEKSKYSILSRHSTNGLKTVN